MFKVNELLKATQGKLRGGKTDTKVLGISIDSRTIKKGDAFISLRGKNFDGHDFIEKAIKKGASCIIAERLSTKGLRAKTAFIEVKDTTRTLGEIAKFQREKFDIPVIAVTGSNGKTTAKEMIAACLSTKFKVLKNGGTKNNHIGLPMTLLGLNNSYDLAVLEAGSNHLGEIEYLARICQPNIAVITNVGNSHLEFLKSVRGVYQEKAKLLKYLRNPRIAVLNADDSLLKNKVYKMNNGSIAFSFSIRNKADFSASDIRRADGYIEFLVNKKYRFTLRTLGYYNIYNALVAVSCGRLFGLDYRDIAASLAKFTFPQSRLNLIELKRIKFINDTYNSNPVSLKQALDALDNYYARGRKIFVMGDMLELGKRGEHFHYKAGQDAAAVCDVLIAVGRLSQSAAEGARQCGLDSKNIFTCTSAQEARDILAKRIALCPDDIVLVKGSRSMAMEEVLKF